jgi:hypothetical protein
MNVLFVKTKISKLINYSTNNVCVEVAKVLWYLVIGPMELEKIIQSNAVVHCE